MVRSHQPGSCVGVLAVALTACALALAPTRAGAAEERIQVLPPDEKAFGLTLTQWAIAFCQWDGSLPLTGHPGTDSTGLQTALGQRMPVWFLPSANLGTSYTRTVIVPAGCSLLLPGPYGMFWNSPGVATDEQLIGGASLLVGKFLDLLKVLEVSIDGVPIPDLGRYRVQTPVFSIVFPRGNWFGSSVRAGQDQRQAMAAEGYFFLLSPPAVGKHVIQIRMEGTDTLPNKTFKDSHTINLIIQEPNVPIQ